MKSSEYLLCSELAENRSQVLGREFLVELEEMEDVNIEHLFKGHLNGPRVTERERVILSCYTLINLT